MMTEVLESQREAAWDVAADLDAAARDAHRAPHATRSPVVMRLRRLAKLSGLPLLCANAVTGKVLAKSHASVLELLPADIAQRLPEVAAIETVEHASGLVFHLVPLADVEGRPAVGVAYCFTRPDSRPHELVLAAAERNWSEKQLAAWRARQPHGSARMSRTVFEMALRQLEQEDREAAWQTELEQLSTQIDHTYEEISLLHALTRNLQISRSPAELAELCLNRMQALVRSAGNVVWIEEGRQSSVFLVEGDVPFDCDGLARLIARFGTHDWTRPLVKNHLAETPLAAEFPGLNTLVIVPIAQGVHRYGWIVSCNRAEGEEFGTIEASLLNSVATILGTHIRNIDLYRQHDDLLLSFVRSLVSTIDARDPYTRGHSDRVALIGRRLAAELGLPETQRHQIYMSGLLHDIGKIGIDDRVLRKPGRLTPEEFEHIKRHPVIGYEILRGLKNLQPILPGVRNHHEAFDGSGYPDGLSGEDIPLMARILAVADSYDAMNSDRPYRGGLPLEQIEEAFRQGSGTQWDPDIVDAYFRIREDVHRIAAEYSPHTGDLLDSVRSSLAEGI